MAGERSPSLRVSSYMGRADVNGNEVVGAALCRRYSQNVAVKQSEFLS